MTTKVKGNNTEEPNLTSDKKTCFVVMPIADMHEYDSGHFARVYEYLIKPALVGCGYAVERADDTVKSDYIVVGIVQKIIESDMVICDLSGRNANVMYELGIRHAFDKPVVLIKDKRTEKVFDIQGLRYYEYDQSLRIDTVKKDLEKITNSVNETASDNSKSINSIVRLANIHSAKLPERTEVSADTQILLGAINSLQKRLIDVESKQSKFSRPITRALDLESVLFDNFTEAFKNDVIYENGEALGILIGGNSDYIIVKKPDGVSLPIPKKSDDFSKLSAEPF